MKITFHSQKGVDEMLKLQERIEIKRRHDKKQAIVNLVEYTVAMLIIILFCSINDRTLDNLFR